MIPFFKALSELESLNLLLGSQGDHLSKPVLVNNNRGYMVLCEYCRNDVKPKMHLTWRGFICGLGIFYLIYIFMKIPQCPNCNFPMPRGSMIFAFHLPQQLKEKVMSSTRRSDPSKNFVSTNTHQTTYFNMMECGLKTTLNLSEPTVKKEDPG
jgi:hypothetical protein